MKLFRKKILTIALAVIVSVALMNISVQLATIIHLFPNMNISYVLAEELLETTGDCAEKNLESSFGLDLFLAKHEYSLHNLNVNNAVISFFHRVQIPPHPCLDKVVPPPKG